jgi:hypothetical protein
LVRAAVAAAESELRVRAIYRPADRRRIEKRSKTAVPAQPVAGKPQLLSVLGRDRAVIADIGGEHDEKSPVGSELSIRHSELLFLLAQHTEGYTADQLAIALHERDIPAVTVRAELSRLRAILPGLGLAGRPYRITGGLQTDVAAVRALLAGDDVAAAVAAYPGPILPSSESPEVKAERDLLHREIRSAVMCSTDPEAVLAFANAASGRDDVLVWRHAVELAHPSTRPVLLERLHRMEMEFGAPPSTGKR